MNIFTKVIVGVLILALGAIGLAYSGFVNVSARSGHGMLSSWFLSTTSRNSIERHARDIAAPDLSDPKLILSGANDFQSMCIACHGGPGIDALAVGKGLIPLPPDLAESAGHMTAAELFWVTKNGVRMTGMPAWGATHEDSEIWPVVAFLTTLPDMDPAEYQSLLEQASGMGHHAAGEDHSHQGAERQTSGSASSTEATDDGADHEGVHHHQPGHDHADDAEVDSETQAESVQEPEAESHRDHKH